MRVLMLVVSLALSLQQVPAREISASCQVQTSSVVGRSASGIAQVSNLALLYFDARVPTRQLTGSGHAPLRVDVTVHEIGAGGVRRVVPSTINASGGGGDTTFEDVHFTVDIPIDPAVRDVAIRTYLASLVAAVASSSDPKQRAMASAVEQMARSSGGPAFESLFREHRVGRFEIECRILDGDRTVGIARENLEVLDKGRFFDQEALRLPANVSGQTPVPLPADPRLSDPEFIRLRDEAFAARDCVDRTEPVALSEPAARYPDALREQRVQGGAMTESMILSDGTIKYTRVLRTDHAEFGKAALAVLERYRYKPGTCGGKPVPRFVTVVHTFKLQ